LEEDRRLSADLSFQGVVANMRFGLLRAVTQLLPVVLRYFVLKPLGL